MAKQYTCPMCGEENSEFRINEDGRIQCLYCGFAYIVNTANEEKKDEHQTP